MRGRSLQPGEISDVHRPLFDADRFPPAGTPCADCGCCKAGIYAGAGEDRVAICMACDEGVPCAGKRAQQLNTMRQAVIEALPEEVEAVKAKMHEAGIAEPEPQPAAPAAEPAPLPEKNTMAERHCKGGCGKALPASNKSGYAWGHSKGCPGELPPPARLSPFKRARSRSTAPLRSWSS